MRESLRYYPMLIAGYAILCLLQLATGVWLFALKFGFTTTKINEAFSGNPERFIAPRSFSGLLETAVPHLIAMGTVAFIISHFLPFLPRISSRVKWGLGLAIPLFALVDIASGFLVRFASPRFAILKLAGFMGFELAVCGALGLIFFTALPRNRGNAR